MIVKRLSTEELNKTVQNQITELYKQLNSSINQLSIEQILSTTNDTIIIVCEENKQIIGIAMIAKYKVISGYKGIIEDVVVHEEHRRKGIGRKLILNLLEEAQNCNLTEVLLFSGHHRVNAISLYKSVGFTLKNSGMYTLKI